MNNDRPTHPLTASNIAKLQKICISMSTDSDDSDKTKSYYSESEHESLSSTDFPVQYKLPQRNHSMVNSPVNRTPMDRMAATNISVRMKHGKTARDIIVPLNRNTATPSSSGMTRRNTTTPSNSGTMPLNRGKAQRDTTTQLNNSKPTQNALPASSFYVPAHWMFPSTSSSRSVPSSNKFNTPMLPPKSRAPAPPYTAPPPYVEPSNKPQTSKHAKRSQCPIPPYRYPSSSPPYTAQSSSLTYTSRSSSLTNTSQSFAMRNMSQTLTSSVRSQSSTPSYRPKYPTPSYSPKHPAQADNTLSFMSLCMIQSSSQTTKSQTFKTPNTSRTSKTPNIFQISKTPNTPKTSMHSMHSKRSQSSTPSYRPRCPTPTSGPPYTSQSSSLTNTSPTSSYSLKSESSTPSHNLRNSMLTDSNPTSVPLQTSQSSERTNKSQTSTYSLKSESSTPSHNLRNSTLTDSNPTSVPLQTSQFSELTNTSQTSQSATPSRSLQNSKLIDSILTPVTLQASQSSELTNTSQTSKYFLRSQSSTPSRNLQHSTLPSSSQSFAPIDKSKPSSSSQSHTSQSSASTEQLLTRPSIRLTPRYAHYNASPSFSHYTFPRAEHYSTPVSGTYYTVMPQSSTENSYPLSVFEPTCDVWPTEVGSEAQVSMHNVWSVLASQVQYLLPLSTTANLQNPSKPSTATSANEEASQPLQKVESRKSHGYPSVDCLPLYLEGIEKTDALENQIKNELKDTWIYFNHLQVFDIKPTGNIKCVCPKLKYVDVLKSALHEKFMLVNMSRQYKANNLRFETTHDYTNIPELTIVDENLETQIMEWLKRNNLQQYDWFFKTLNYFEIQNISPTNIQRFVIRSNCNKSISLVDQLKICCLAKQIKERPVSLIAILIYLRSDDDEYKRTIVTEHLIPFIEEMLQFPISSENCKLEDVMNQYINEIWHLLVMYIMHMFQKGGATDTNNATRNSAGQFLHFKFGKTGSPKLDIEMLKKYLPTKLNNKK